jgi:hypothetical protein
MNSSPSNPEMPMCMYKGRDLKELKRLLEAGNEAALKFAEHEFLTVEFHKRTGSVFYAALQPDYRNSDLEYKKRYWDYVWDEVKEYAITLGKESHSPPPKVKPIMPTLKEAADPQRTIISEFTARISGQCKFLNAVYQSNATRKVPGNVRGTGEWLGAIPVCPCQGNMPKVELSFNQWTGWGFKSYNQKSEMPVVPMTFKEPAVRVNLVKINDKVDRIVVQEGLATGNMGACITVACLFSMTNKPGGVFTHASMKHMAGGYRKDFPWTSLVGSVSPQKVIDLCHNNNAFALVATTRDNLEHPDEMANVLRKLRELGFPPENTIVDMMMNGGFAVNKKGEFGVPVKTGVVRLAGKELGRATMPPRVGQ